MIFCYGFPFLCAVRRVVLRVYSGGCSPGFSTRIFLDRLRLSFISPLVASTPYCVVSVSTSSVIRSSLSLSKFEVAICCAMLGVSMF